MSRPYRATNVRALALCNRPSTFFHEPVHERSHSIRQRFIDSPLNDLAEIAVRPGNRQRDHCGLTFRTVPELCQRHIFCLSRTSVIRAARSGLWSAFHHSLESGVDSLLNCRYGSETDIKVELFTTSGLYLLFDLFIQRDVRTTKPINRLLGIADDKELAWNRPHSPPVFFIRLVGRQQHQQFGLQRIGVLKLIDEDVCESLLEVRSHPWFFTNQISRTKQ